MSDQQNQPQKKRRFFQRTRERIEEFEKTHDNFRTVVEHLDEHKEAYLAGASCLVIGFLTGKHHRRPSLSATIITNTITSTPAPVVETVTETLAPWVDDKWNVLGLTTDELTTLLDDPSEHLHFESSGLGNLCIQHFADPS